MDIHSVDKSFSALNYSESQITKALDRVRKLQNETVLEKDSGTIPRQDQAGKTLKRLEVKEKSLLKNFTFLNNKRSELMLEPGLKCHRSNGHVRMLINST